MPDHNANFRASLEFQSKLENAPPIKLKLGVFTISKGKLKGDWLQQESKGVLLSFIGKLGQTL